MKKKKVKKVVKVTKIEVRGKIERYLRVISFISVALK